MSGNIPLWQHEEQLRQAREKLRMQKIAAKLKQQNNQPTINAFDVLKRMPEGWTGKINVGNK